MFEHEIHVPASRLFNHATQEFYYIDAQTVVIVHSLMAISKWEAKWKRPYFSKKRMSFEQSMDYIRCMTITKNVDEKVYYAIATNERLMSEVNSYLEDTMTATFFPPSSDNAAGPKERVTSELIYYYMTAFNIPFSCEKWHINRLITLIEMCSRKAKPSKKNRRMSASAIAKRNKTIAKRNADHGWN